mgnify:CR=1 FL=1
MIMPSVRIRSIELSMPSIEAFRHDIVAGAFRARDMILGPHRYLAEDLLVAIEAINATIARALASAGLDTSTVAGSGKDGREYPCRFFC